MMKQECHLVILPDVSVILAKVTGKRGRDITSVSEFMLTQLETSFVFYDIVISDIVPMFTLDDEGKRKI